MAERKQEVISPVNERPSDLSVRAVGVVDRDSVGHEVGQDVQVARNGLRRPAGLRNTQDRVEVVHPVDESAGEPHRSGGPSAAYVQSKRGTAVNGDAPDR